MLSDREIYVYAQTIFGEARSEGLEGMVAVAWVIQNRRARSGWPDSVIDVCLQPAQFSMWNPRDPNFKKAILQDMDNAAFLPAMFVALGVILGYLPDPTQGADHYHAIDISPGWARDMAPTVRIKRHQFYNSQDRRT